MKSQLREGNIFLSRMPDKGVMSRIYFVFIYLKYGITEKKKTQKLRVVSTCHITSQMATVMVAGMAGAAKARSPESPLGLSLGYRGPSTCLMLCCFPGKLAGSCFRSEAAKDWNQSALGSWCCRKSNVICHNAGPQNQFLQIDKLAKDQNKHVTTTTKKIWRCEVYL